MSTKIADEYVPIALNRNQGATKISKRQLAAEKNMISLICSHQSHTSTVLSFYKRPLRFNRINLSFCFKFISVLAIAVKDSSQFTMENDDVEFSINFTQQKDFRESYFRNNRYDSKQPCLLDSIQVLKTVF